MPNHYTSSVVILGAPSAVQSAYDILTEPSDEALPHVTFDKLIPMPEALVGTVSPAEVVDTAEEAAKINAKWNSSGMAALSDGTWQRRALTSAEYGALMREHGAANWYDWSVKHWGTKWNAYEVTVAELSPEWHVHGAESEGRLDLQFQTAWSPPVPVFEKLAADYDVRIYVLGQDEGSDDIDEFSYGADAGCWDAPHDFMYTRTTIEFA